MFDLDHLFTTLMERSEQVGNCLIWHGAVDFRGYGAIYYAGALRKVHRLGFQCHTGKEPVLSVLHRCDTPLCWAKDHIYEGTQQQNVDDMIARGRAQFINPQIGSKNGHSTLNEQKVAEIKYLLNQGHSQSGIAFKFGVDITTINKIHRGRSWTHVKEMSNAIKNSKTS